MELAPNGLVLGGHVVLIRALMADQSSLGTMRTDSTTGNYQLRIT